MKCKFQTMKYRFVCGAENLGGGFGVFLGLFAAGVGGVATAVWLCEFVR